LNLYGYCLQNFYAEYSGISIRLIMTLMMITIITLVNVIAYILGW
jgi:hypothetical protein